MTQGEQRYGIVIGGVHRTDRGEVDASIAPVAVYTGMTYEHIQAFWKWIQTNPAVALAMQNFQQAMAVELAKLGDQFGIETGKATAETLKGADITKQPPQA